MVSPNCWRSGCAGFLLCLATAISSPAQTFTTLASFGSYPVGGSPLSPLVQGLDGEYYGTTAAGGGTNCNGACGTAFKITAGGTLTALYNFAEPNGGAPSRLALATSGNFYGTTYYGYGTVFKITAGGTLTTLDYFSSGVGPQLPEGGLMQATNGNLYGTTYSGGAHAKGTVFEITPAGTLTTLYSFCALASCADGVNPVAPLVQASNGNFYGTTQYYGAYGNGGTVFEITPVGTVTTLYSFCKQTKCADGQQPAAGLVQAANGNFYGTTFFGGANGKGTVFEITPAGTLTTLHSFDGTDGSGPQAGLVQATDGNFYGVTTYGGNNSYPLNNCGSSCGTVFEITSGGTLTTLYSFCKEAYCPDGYYPEGLVQGTDGTFYGTASAGGARNVGTAFSLSTGLGPFVTTLPTSGNIGTPVTILGTSLTGATSVTFNGKAAAFTVISATEITTTVPTGATTGVVKVVRPSGTLSSNVSFRIP
jgi:uncharacterized repeat protein (TIGR03803 family)